MSLVLKAGTDWQTVLERAASAAPEAISVDGLKNLIDGEWVSGGNIKPHVNPVDGMPILGPTMLDVDSVMHAVQASKTQDMAWAKVSITERKQKVSTL
jgi:NAD-dependent aldehyde dehydrogenases